MSTFVNVLVFIGILAVLVVLHELGHMVVAKRCGMRVERFSLFFGKPLYTFTKGETEYRVGWLPAGGYVKITGMTRDELVHREYDPKTRELISETPLPPEVQARAYCNSTTPRKVATILAGPMANVVVAVLAFAMAFWIGIPQYDASNVVSSVNVGSAAAQAGLQPGDRIVSINGVSANDEDPTPLFAQIQGNVGTPVEIVVQRGDEPLRTLTGTPQPDASSPAIGRLGFRFDANGRRLPDQQFGFFRGIGEAVSYVGYLTKAQVQALGKLFVDEQTRSEVSSVVGIGATYNDIAASGFAIVLQFVGILSLILAIMNLLPILPLDGGHIVFALIERIRRRPIAGAVFQRASIAGIAVVLFLVIFALNNDITRFTGGGFKP